MLLKDYIFLHIISRMVISETPFTSEIYDLSGNKNRRDAETKALRAVSIWQNENGQGVGKG